MSPQDIVNLIVSKQILNFIAYLNENGYIYMYVQSSLIAKKGLIFTFNQTSGIFEFETLQCDQIGLLSGA